MDLKKLLKQMTLEEKIGQFVQCTANLFSASDAEVTGPLTNLGLSKEDLRTVGSILNFKKVEDAIATQKQHLEEDRNKIPLLFMLDVIHGYRTIFPIPLAMGASFDPELLAECTRMASKEASASGVHVTFTPMVDYVRDARWGRVMETCGEDPMLNGIMGAVQVKAFQGNDISDPDNMATCVKHFAAYGGAEAGRDYNTVELSERILREYYLPAYKACIDAGTTMLMPSFNSLNGVPAIANSWLMKKVLKEEWGFNGVVVSDYNAVGELLRHGIAGNKKDAAKYAFENGCDIEMYSTAYIHYLKELVEEGVFTEQQIDEAVMRILELKDRMGLFEDPYHGASPEKAKAVCLCPEHRAIARKAAREAAVLLKNENSVLPFSANVKKVALIGPFADNRAINGFWSCCGNIEETVTVEEGVRAMLPNSEITVVGGCGNLHGDTDRSGFEAAVKAAAEADAVVLCLGEPFNYSGEGNCRTDLDLPGVQNELAEAVVAANPNTAVLLFNGRPLAITKLSETVPAILEMWFTGTEGGNAAADLLFGKANPCGKITMSFPKTAGQCPVYYNHPNTGRPKSVVHDAKHVPYSSNYIDCTNLPLYSFGHGLSYSSFEYESMSLSNNTLKADEEIKVSITVVNNSETEGKETVQLYMRDLVASTVRPVQQLIAFDKILLKAGERKTVEFAVTEPMLRFVDAENKFISEPGEFELYTGYADHLKPIGKFNLI